MGRLVMACVGCPGICAPAQAALAALSPYSHLDTHQVSDQVSCFTKETQYFGTNVYQF